MPRKVTIAAGSDEDEEFDNGMDTSSENEMPPPPRPRKSGLRKSLSMADESFTSDSGRANARSADINDDAAEKRRRRKSTRAPADGPMAGPSRDADDDGARPNKRLTMVQPPVIDVPKDVMNSNFDEWMKMHTDNKINAANSWGVFLIDYFADMSLLRNGDDNSINFQRASSTLDGCVKIWTSRVDSVGTDTAKLASNLASGRNDAYDESGDDELDDPSQPKKKRSQRSGATLKEASQLRSKKIETEFLVDPLFKKTCADFDEGGAQGLLMNHLSLGVGKDGGLRVVFDAGDSISKGDDDDDIVEDDEDVDLSDLRKKFLPDLSILDDLEICPELSTFSFLKDPSAHQIPSSDDMGQPSDEEEEEEEPVADMSNVDDVPVADYFDAPGMMDDDDNFGGGDDNFGGGDDDDGDEHSNGSVAGGSNQTGDVTGGFVPFDGRDDRSGLQVSMDANNSHMEQFDHDSSLNWAGPEHYKGNRKFLRKAEKDASKPKVGRREKKEPVKIDFSAPPNKTMKELAADLFAQGKAINAPAKKNGEKRDEHRLPNDMHFTSRQLISLFLKPKFSLTMRGRAAPGNNTNDEVDENFWAQAAADQAAGRPEGGDDNDAAFPTQFLHDDFDDGPGFDDGFDGVGAPDAPDEEELLAATQGQQPRVKPPTVTYAKRAKRIDVKKLKDNIWKGLEIVTPHGKKEKEDDMDVDEEDDTFTDPTEAREFGSVISNLERSYPQEKMDDISTSFCFICLLHLANEQGLRLDEGVPKAEVDGSERIAKLWDVKVYRDPEADSGA